MNAETNADAGEYRVPAPAIRQSQDFQSELMRYLEARLDAQLDTLVSRQNRYHFTHGSEWGSLADPGRGPDRFQLATAEVAVGFEAVATQDLISFRDSVEALAEQMARAIVGGLIDTVSQEADKVGNSVSVLGQGSNAAAFLEMLRRVEFGVDSDGQVTLPSLHAGPGFAQKLLAEIEAQGPEFHAEVERLKQEKTQAALAREQARRSKYRR